MGHESGCSLLGNQSCEWLLATQKFRARHRDGVTWRAYDRTGRGHHWRSVLRNVTVILGMSGLLGMSRLALAERESDAIYFFQC